MDFDLYIPIQDIQDNISWIVAYPPMLEPSITVIGIVQLERLDREEPYE